MTASTKVPALLTARPKRLSFFACPVTLAVTGLFFSMAFDSEPLAKPKQSPPTSSNWLTGRLV